MTTCARAGCGTTLSTYNAGPLCSAHTGAMLQPLLKYLIPQAWEDQAECKRLYGKVGIAPVWAEPYSRERADPLGSHKVRKAKAMCARCPVRRECLTAALGSPVPLVGIWGGTLPHERVTGDVDTLLEEMAEQARAKGLAA